MTHHPLFLPALLHLALVLLAGWLATSHPVWLAAAAACVAAAALAGRVRGRGVAGVVGLVALAITAGFAADHHLTRVSHDWPDRAGRWETEIRRELSEELDRLLLEGEDAAARLVTQMEEVGAPGPTTIPPDLRPEGVDAVAVFGPGGELLAWDGSHQGPVPRAVRLGLRPYAYEEGALFGYLYVIRPLLEGRGTAVAATLLRADLPASLEDVTGDFVSRFERRTGAELHVARSDRVEGESVWDLRWDGDVLFSVSLTPVSEAEVRARIDRRWRLGIFLAILFAWGLLVAATRDRTGAGGIAAAGMAVLIPVVPFGALFPIPRLFSPADFLLPGPVGLSLGHLLVLSVAAVGLLGFLRPAQVRRIPPVVSAGLGLSVGLGWLLVFGQGTSRDLLAGPEVLWVLFQATGVLSLSALLYPTLLAGRDRSADLRGGRFALGMVLALALGGLAAWWVRGNANFPFVLSLAWVVPFHLVLRSLGSDERWRAGALRWIGVGVVAATLILPWAWGERVEARMAVAEERVERLGTTPDPFLEYLLLRTGEEARTLAGTGREPVEVLYSSWTESGLALEGVPVWLTWWSPDGVPTEELRIGVPGLRPQIPVDLILQAISNDRVELRRMNLSDAHYVAAVPVGGGGVVTAVVPPRRGVLSEFPLGPLFTPAHTEPDPLALIPILPGERPADEGDGLRWMPTRDGFQGETQVRYPGEVYHGHYLLELPGGLLLIARGTILILGTLALVLILWSGARRLVRGPGGGSGRARAALTSFRGRVTMALFGFFLLPTILFGMLAYRTLAGASVRTAEALAARAVDDAASWYFDTDGALDLLASRVGADLLLYDGGQLVGGSMRELVELGLYEGWLPPSVQQNMGRGEELTATTMATLGGWEYVVAFQRIPGGLVLAAPAPLQAGATAVRQREVADLLGFALILGAGLSVLLALGVGRALTRPIQTLQIASERVGSGNMGVHLPEDRTDEFGAVFGAFNRMVDRLSRTRRALVTSSRRTRAIVEEVATGVVALDSEGRVTLANPRAETLLGTALQVRSPLPGSDVGGRSLDSLGEWVDRYLRDGLVEAGTEFTFGDRRIRVRARRISEKGSPGGAVLAFEDVTDELRTERILAWGEMAQQVAHEVKNPLTPIKLGIQHIRRAWRDGSDDYDRILDRNVEAILREIERLASVASSFSRYAAPSPSGATPLARVSIERVLGEVMDLYSAGDGRVRFSAEVPADLPAVRARSGELKEVLVNLLENARTALPDGGRVRIEVLRRPAGVILRVLDDGRGIPDEVLPRIFEPHFSTHSSGSGLGLAIVRRLVESWGGRVRVARTSAEGTTVEVEMIPWDEDRAEEGAPTGSAGE